MTHDRAARRADPDAPAVNPAAGKIIWLSFLLAVVAYGGVGYWVLGRGGAPAAVPSWIWAVLAGAIAAASWWVPRRMSGGPGSGSGVRNGQIVGWALAETVAVLGLVAVALGGDRTLLVPYLLVAAVLLWLQRPTDS